MFYSLNGKTSGSYLKRCQMSSICQVTDGILVVLSDDGSGFTGLGRSVNRLDGDLDRLSQTGDRAGLVRKNRGKALHRVSLLARGLGLPIGHLP